MEAFSALLAICRGIHRSPAVSGVIEHMGLEKGLDMVDKAGVGWKIE